MVRWSAPTLAALDTATAAARSGGPTVLAIEGEAGFGKTTLLREAVSRLDGFTTLRAFGEEGAQDDRFQVLQEWDALPEGAGAPRHILQAARQLAQVVDRRQRTGPVALVVDDLQWIDAESVDAITAFVQRAAGDRLLVLAAHRPLGRRHPGWRRLSADAGISRTVHLDGLDPDGAAALVRSLDPDAPSGLAERLRVHTGGSPLYMRALLQEHPSRELASLAARGELPAPADLAIAVGARIAELAPDAARMLRALAVLGNAWVDLPTAVAVGGVSDADAAVTVLRDEDLLRLDRTAEVPRIRISHAVIGAAVYDTIPGTTRRTLHGAAAARLTDGGLRLRHRLATAAGPDEGLATDLDRHADGLHGRAQFREAARFRRLAARVTAGDTARERRLLDADVESILGHDLEDVSVTHVDPASSPHRRLVHAMRLSSDKLWVQAARVLDTLGPNDIAGLDPLNAYRARVLHGHAMIGSGRPAGDALPPLEKAAAAPVRDTALRGQFTFAYGQAKQATIGRNDALWGFDELFATDRATLATSLEGLVRLSWRGSAHAVTGTTGKAIGDLSVVTGRIDDGTLDLGDGALHALLGFAQWMAGEWRRASITIDIAEATPRAVPHPVVFATVPLAAVVTGDGLEQALVRSRDARLAAPLPGALHAGDIAEVAALAFAGTPQQRRDWRARRTEDFGDPDAQAHGVLPYLWLLTMGLGAAWAGDGAATQRWAEALAGLDGGVWRLAGVAWLRALAVQARGEAAAEALIAAAGSSLSGLASFDAVLWVDAAQAAAREVHPAAVEVRARAESVLATLEAGAYASALLPALASEEAVPAREDPLAALSDREREVAALLLEGLSYAQIAKELYVTRSTVAFHLSNAYAKTSTASRHEFVQLVRPPAVTARRRQAPSG
jgi:DNA-binding CsgD family transcriptional regulator